MKMNKNTNSEPTIATQLLNRPEAAKYLGVSTQTLAIWASTKRYSLPIVKIGRIVKYRLNDLEKSITDNIV